MRLYYTTCQQPVKCAIIRAMPRQPQTEYSLPAAIGAVVTEKLKGTYTALPGVIVAYNRLTRRASVKCALENISADTKEPIPRRTVKNVPVIWPGTPRWTMNGNLQADDPVLLVFSQRGMRAFKDEHATVPVAPEGLHSESDAIAIAGFGAAPPGITDADETAELIIQEDDGGTYQAFKDGRVEIWSGDDARVVVLDRVVAMRHGSQLFRANANDARFQTPRCRGVFTSGGTINIFNTGGQNIAITSSGAVTVQAATSLTLQVGGISMVVSASGVAITGGTVTHNGTNIGDTHTHPVPGVTTGGSTVPSGTPV